MRYSSIVAIITLLVAGVAYAQSPAIPDCFEDTTRPPLGMISAASQGNTEIRLKTDAIVGARVVGDTLFLFKDGPVKFPLEYVNRDSISYNPSNSFKVFSPDGATWAHASPNGGNVKFSYSAGTMPGIWVDTTGTYIHIKDDLGGLYKFQLFSADGAGSDTLLFNGAANDASQRAIPAQDSGFFYYVIIRPKLADTGKHICIDSANYCGMWKWPVFNYQPYYSAYPIVR